MSSLQVNNHPPHKQGLTSNGVFFYRDGSFPLLVSEHSTFLIAALVSSHSHLAQRSFSQLSITHHDKSLVKELCKAAVGCSGLGVMPMFSKRSKGNYCVSIHSDNLFSHLNNITNGFTEFPIEKLTTPQTMKAFLKGSLAVRGGMGIRNWESRFQFRPKFAVQVACIFQQFDIHPVLSFGRAGSVKITNLPELRKLFDLGAHLSALTCIN